VHVYQQPEIRLNLPAQGDNQLVLDGICDGCKILVVRRGNDDDKDKDKSKNNGDGDNKDNKRTRRYQ
jgi:hypothetical protein